MRDITQVEIGMSVRVDAPKTAHHERFGWVHAINTNEGPGEVLVQFSREQSAHFTPMELDYRECVREEENTNRPRIAVEVDTVVRIISLQHQLYGHVGIVTGIEQHLVTLSFESPILRKPARTDGTAVHECVAYKAMLAAVGGSFDLGAFGLSGAERQMRFEGTPWLSSDRAVVTFNTPEGGVSTDVIIADDAPRRVVITMNEPGIVVPRIIGGRKRKMDL